MWEAVFFYLIAAVTVVTALLMVLMKNPVVSAVYLVVTFFGVAALYVLLNAQLLAALQVIVYAGAIMVLFMFVVMLLNLNRTAFTSYKLFFTKLFAVLLICFILWSAANWLGELAAGRDEALRAATGELTEEQRAELRGRLEPQPPRDKEYFVLNQANEGHSMSFAETLFTVYIYPFEVISIMLLAAIVGAVLMAKRREV